MDSQTKVLRRGADVIIATPGRLIDHLERGNVNLSGIQVLVLDEADRMLDMGFIKDVRRIIGRVPPERQTLLFSATLSRDVTELAAGILHEPHTVEAGERRTPVETIVQRFFSAPREQKTELLLHLLQGSGMDSVLVFSRTKHGADKICRRLDRAGITAVAIHSNRTQSQRERALEGFRQGKFRVLVATDIAARGIDVSGISHVINYDVPQYAEDYIHRIGRTGRAGAEGEAITFVGHDEQQYVRRIEQYTGKRYSVHSCPGFTPRPQTSGQQLDPRPEAVARSRHVSHGKPAAGSRARHHQETGSARETQPKHPYRTKAGAQRKRSPFTTPPRKKAPPKRFDSFSSNLGGAGWSNY
jgi:ATP-dependent RNA helicase RhlE